MLKSGPCGPDFYFHQRQMMVESFGANRRRGLAKERRCT
jgi:hypothetical protein